MAQDTGKNRKNIIDAFYTPVETAIQCAKIAKNHIQYDNTYFFVEPSAGSYNFVNGWNQVFQVDTDKLIAIDIEPKSPKVQKIDFFAWKPLNNSKYIVIGNPPFGRQAGMAKRFIKHCVPFAKYIAFILPLSFQKPSMQKVFPLNWKCLYSQRLENDEFIINDLTKHQVPCVFQIWEKLDGYKREVKKVDTELFNFVKKQDSFDIAIRRVGVNAGRTHLAKDGKDLNTNTHNFVKFKTESFNVSNIVEEMNKLKVEQNTTGPKSISKGEITEMILNVIEKPGITYKEQ